MTPPSVSGDVGGDRTGPSAAPRRRPLSSSPVSTSATRGAGRAATRATTAAAAPSDAPRARRRRPPAGATRGRAAAPGRGPAPRPRRRRPAPPRWPVSRRPRRRRHRGADRGAGPRRSASTRAQERRVGRDPRRLLGRGGAVEVGGGELVEAGRDRSWSGFQDRRRWLDVRAPSAWFPGSSSGGQQGPAPGDAGADRARRDAEHARRSRRSRGRRGRGARRRRGTPRAARPGRRRWPGGRGAPSMPARDRPPARRSPRSSGRPGVGRRLRRRSSSRQALVATRYAQVEKAARPSKRRMPAGDGDQRLLGGVEGVGVVAGQPAAHRVDAVVVAAEQRVEGGAVAGLGGARRAPGRRARAAMRRSAIPGDADRSTAVLDASPAAPAVPSPRSVIQTSTACPRVPPRSTLGRRRPSMPGRAWRPGRPSRRGRRGRCRPRRCSRRPVVGGAGRASSSSSSPACSAVSTRPTPGLSTRDVAVVVALGASTPWRGRRRRHVGGVGSCVLAGRRPKRVEGGGVAQHRIARLGIRRAGDGVA